MLCNVPQCSERQHSTCNPKRKIPNTTMQPTIRSTTEQPIHYSTSCTTTPNMLPTLYYIIVQPECIPDQMRTKRQRATQSRRHGPTMHPTFCPHMSECDPHALWQSSSFLALGVARVPHMSKYVLQPSPSASPAHPTKGKSCLLLCWLIHGCIRGPAF